MNSPELLPAALPTISVKGEVSAIDTERIAKILGIAGCVCLCLGILWYCFGSGSNTVQKDADSTVSTMEKRIAGATTGLESAGSRNQSAQEAIDRANDQLGEGQRAATESAERLERISEIVKRCQERNQRLIEGLQSAEDAAPKGEGES